MSVATLSVVSAHIASYSSSATPCAASRNETSPGFSVGVAPRPRYGFDLPPGHVAIATNGDRRGTGIEGNGANPMVWLTSPGGGRPFDPEEHAAARRRLRSSPQGPAPIRAQRVQELHERLLGRDAREHCNHDALGPRVRIKRAVQPIGRRCRCIHVKLDGDSTGLSGESLRELTARHAGAQP